MNVQFNNNRVALYHPSFDAIRILWTESLAAPFSFMSEAEGTTLRHGGGGLLYYSGRWLCLWGKICILSESRAAMGHRSGVRERESLQSVEYEFAMGVGDDAAASLPRRKYAPEIRFWASQGSS